MWMLEARTDLTFPSPRQYLISLSLSQRAERSSQCPSFTSQSCKTGGSVVKNPPATRKTWVRSLGWADPLDPCIVRKDPRVPHTARRGAGDPLSNSRGQRPRHAGFPRGTFRVIVQTREVAVLLQQTGVGCGGHGGHAVPLSDKF